MVSNKIADDPTGSFENFIPPLNDFVPYLVVRLADSWGKIFSKSLKRYDISVSRWRVLLAVCSRDGASINEIAAIATMEQASASRIIDQLVSEGLVARRMSEKDGRSVLVWSTEEGIALFRKIWPVAFSVSRKNVNGGAKVGHSAA